MIVEKEENVNNTKQQWLDMFFVYLKLAFLLSDKKHENFS